MNDELLLLLKKHTNTLIEQTKTKPSTETLEFTLKKQVETFPFSPLKKLSGEGNWLLAVTSVETTNTIFIITDENN